MKIKQILATTGLAALLSIGAGVGIAANKGASSVKAEAVASGTITVDLSGEGWSTNTGGQNISVYFWDNDSHDGWGSYVFAGYNYCVAAVDYELDFTPTGMKAVRYNNWYSEENWKADPWGSSDEHKTWAKWNETNDVTFVENGNIVVGGDGYSFTGFAYVHGTEVKDGSWGTLFNLNKVKANLSGNIEYYGEYTFNGYAAFGVKLWASDWFAYDSLTISSYANDGSWASEGGNISRVETASPITARVYYNRNAGTLYINLPAQADADEWGQTFLDGMTCDGEGSITKDSWTTLSGTYAVLDDSVKAIYLAIKEDGGDGSITESAVARYDYIIKKYGTSKYNDFMGRANEESGIVYPVSAITSGLELSNTDNNMIMIIVISASATMLLATALLIIKKRKSHK